MKKMIMALALACSLLGAGAAISPSQARANDSTFSARHCDSCRAVVHYEQRWVEPVYRNQSVFVGYDGCGRAVYRTQVVCVQQGYYRNVAVTRYVCCGDRRDYRRDDYRGDRHDRRDGWGFRFRFGF